MNPKLSRLWRSLAVDRAGRVAVLGGAGGRGALGEGRERGLVGGGAEVLGSEGGGGELEGGRGGGLAGDEVGGDLRGRGARYQVVGSAVGKNGSLFSGWRSSRASLSCRKVGQDLEVLAWLDWGPQATHLDVNEKQSWAEWSCSAHLVQVSSFLQSARMWP